ncbi:hypothetical protein IGL98_003283 [Enterococcus sp. DIV0840]|uniref:hypothetical protein n=1 Tax=unclassified Enterococcus TaxID=2608891 RepID=UPI001A9011B2|nr:hypothetical protein [Enterococcus sp. DIV0849a]MBO0435456.1 hypothetical protein [Enterococcus sp. DIV0849a]
MKNKIRIIFTGCIILSGFLYTYSQSTAIKAKEKINQDVSVKEIPKETNSTTKKVQGPKNKASSSYRRDVFTEQLDSLDWVGRSKKDIVRSISDKAILTGGYGRVAEQLDRFHTANSAPDKPYYATYRSYKPYVSLIMSKVGIGFNKNPQGPLYRGVEQNEGPEWQRDDFETMSPLIISQTSESGTKVIDVLNMYGLGGEKDPETPPSLIEPGASWYGIMAPNEIPVRFLWSKIVYNVRNNPDAHSENAFDYYLRVEYLIGMDSNTAGSVITGIRVTNIGEETLTGFSIGGRYSIAFKNIPESMYPTNKRPVKYIGGNRGLIFYSQNQDPDSDVATRFSFDSPSRPDNWSAGQITELGHPEQFFAPKYTSFSGPNSSGQEKNNAAYGEIAYSEDSYKENGFTKPYTTGLYVKNTPKDLAPNESTVYSFNLGPSGVISLRPEIMLDENEVSYEGGPHTVTGHVLQYSENSKEFSLQYSFKESGPYTDATKVLNKPGEEVPWSFEIPEDKLQQGVTQDIYVRARDTGTDAISVPLRQTLIYNLKPVITVEKPSWFFTGSGYTINGTWKESEGETVSLYYSLDNGPRKLIGKDLANTPVNTEINFSKEIPATELGSASHELAVWAEDVRGGLSKEEIWSIGPHNKPVISADLTIDKPEIDEGGTVLFTSTFKNNSTHSLWDKVIYETTNAFPENVSVDTSSVKLVADGVAVIPDKVEFGVDRKLKIELGTVKEQTEMKLTYNVVSENGTPPIKTPVNVDQSYKLSGQTADTILVESKSNLQSFTIKPRIASVEILFLEAGTELPLREKVTLPLGLIGDLTPDVSIEVIEGYELTQLYFDSVQQTPLPTKPFQVEYGKVEQVKFYYNGRLSFKTVPTSFDFGIQDAGVERKRFKPEIKGSNLVVSDMRNEKSGWSLKVKVTNPLKNADGIIVPDVIKYNNGSDELVLNEMDTMIFQRKDNTKNEYDLTKEKWNKNEEGFMLDFPSGSLKALGKYHGELEFTLEDAK